MSTLRCRHCGKTLRPTYAHEWQIVNLPNGDLTGKMVKGDLIGYGYEGNGAFCTLRCGYRWALVRV